MSASTTMAGEKKSGRGKKPKPTGEGDGMLYSTFRIFAEDGENLSELADKQKTTIAKLYRELFSATVKKLLIEETKKRLRELENREG